MNTITDVEIDEIANAQWGGDHLPAEQRAFARSVLALQAAKVAELEPVQQQQAPKQWVDAVELAYGWLWNINSEPMAPIPLVDAERAAARARLALLPLLTRTQQWIGIGQVKGILAGEMSAPKREGGSAA